ncbi:hypothetical protein A5N54_13710 [Streptococcus pneumoniae]|nr:hypothetical protein A5N54_13710 [Streptococcus pneumoniae]
MHRQLVAVLHRAPDLVNIGELDLRVHTSGEQVESRRDQAHVAGALAVAEQAALDPISPGRETQLRCGDRDSAHIVRVQAQDDRLPVG